MLCCQHNEADPYPAAGPHTHSGLAPAHAERLAHGGGALHRLWVGGGNPVGLEAGPVVAATLQQQRHPAGWDKQNGNIASQLTAMRTSDNL